MRRLRTGSPQPAHEVAHVRTRVTTDVRARIIGKSPAMQRLFVLLERVAPTRANVLITGETGTGKELVARAIHASSGRARRPFVPVHCSALAGTFLESELLGHQKGAFTGAIQAKQGLFEAAKGGTLFLDEVSSLATSIQAKLLRVIEERAVTAMGGTEPVPVDFRLVAATNEELGGRVRSGRFREDLFYRLNVFPIHVPSLRERREDIPLLAHAFRLRFAEDNGVEAPPLLPETLSRMMAYAWPGNVRELENVIERSSILHAGASSMPFDPVPGAPAVGGNGRRLLDRGRAKRWSLDRLEREYILEILEEEGWHQSRAAGILGIDRRTLYRKVRKFREEGFLPDSGREHG